MDYPVLIVSEAIIPNCSGGGSIETVFRWHFLQFIISYWIISSHVIINRNFTMWFVVRSGMINIIYDIIPVHCHNIFLNFCSYCNKYTKYKYISDSSSIFCGLQNSILWTATRHEFFSPILAYLKEKDSILICILHYMMPKFTNTRKIKKWLMSTFDRLLHPTQLRLER